MILRISKDFWILKIHWKNYHKTLSFTLFSIQTILFILLYFFMRDRGEREGGKIEWEREKGGGGERERGGEGGREREREREKGGEP